MNELSDAEVAALREALDDEYRAWATYEQVMADFGARRPFSNISAAEARHIEALTGVLRHYGLAVPPNSWPGRVPRFASIREACEAGVAAEVANGDLYERLLAATQRPDLVSVFRNLQDASQNRHLPAFRRCADRGPGGGFGQRRHRRGGRS